MSSSPLRELEWRLAEAEAAAAEWQAVADGLLRESEAVFASRRWRLGSALLRPLEWLLQRVGRPLPPAQDAAHWRDVAQAHAAAIAARRDLLRQRLAAGERATPDAIAGVWDAAAPPRP